MSGELSYSLPDLLQGNERFSRLLAGMSTAYSGQVEHYDPTLIWVAGFSGALVLDSLGIDVDSYTQEWGEEGLSRVYCYGAAQKPVVWAVGVDNVHFYKKRASLTMRPSNYEIVDQLLTGALGLGAERRQRVLALDDAWWTGTKALLLWQCLGQMGFADCKCVAMTTSYTDLIEGHQGIEVIVGESDNCGVGQDFMRFAEGVGRQVEGCFGDLYRYRNGLPQ